jgi:hypothetical protein
MWVICIISAVGSLRKLTWETGHHKKGFSALVLELTQRIMAVMLLVASKLSVSVNEAVSVCF